MKKEINQALQKYKKIGEIIIFKEMANSLNYRNASSLFVEEVHGHAGYVEFQSNALNQKIIKEISDLMIISYLPKSKKIRLCFLQAKFRKNKDLTNFLKFRGDYFQYELLYKKPNIVSKSQISFPTDILSSNSNYSSVATYGIFYYDFSKQIDMLYTISDFLQPNKIPTMKNSSSVTFKFPGTLFCPGPKCYQENYYPKHNEAVSTCNLDEFEILLLQGKIGAVINNSQILNFITKVCKNAKQLSNNSDGTVIDDILSFYQIDYPGNEFEFTGSPNVLFLKSTEEMS